MEIKSLTDRFTQAARDFLGLKKKIVIPFSRIEALLELDSPKYIKLDPTARGIDSYGLSRCVYANPEQLIVNPGKPFSMFENHQDELLRSSASLMMDDFPMRFGRWGFIVAIRSEIIDTEDIENAFNHMAFGLYAIRDREGNLKVENMLVPQIDQYRRMTSLHQVDVTDPAEVETALSYLTLCKKQIFDGGPLRARDNWREVTECKAAPPLSPHIS